MSALYGRGYGQARVYYPVPFQRGKRFTIISAISSDKVEAALYGQWCGNGEIFLHFIEQHLCPVLMPRHVVVMDNVAFHQVLGVKEAIEGVGARLIYLPPYSPDLNPIEHHWHKIKTAIRKIMRDVEIKLQDAMERTLKNMSIA